MKKRRFPSTLHKPVPPKLAEKVMFRLLPPDLRDGVLGDFAEEFEERAVGNGRFLPLIWYWQQLLKSVPAFCWLSVTYQLERRWIPMFKSLSTREKQTFSISILCLIPVLLITIPGLFHSFFGQSTMMNAVSLFFSNNQFLSIFIHPVVIIGGLLIALLLNVMPVFNLSLANQEDRIIGAISLKKGYILQYTVISICFLIGLIIFTYLLAENFQLFQAPR
jgi:hypothetical protein